MKDFLFKLDEIKPLNSNAIFKLCDDIIKDYYKRLSIDEYNLSSMKGLIVNQIELIKIEQYLLFKFQLSYCELTYLIEEYDVHIRKYFHQFSKQERKKVANDFGLLPLLEEVKTKDGVGNVGDFNNIQGMDMNQVSNGLRLLNNLELIEFDGYCVEPKSKQKKLGID